LGILDSAISANWSKVLGVDVSQDALQYVLINRKADNTIVDSFGRYSYRGAHDPVEGLYEVLPTLFRRNSHFKHSKLIVGIDESMAVIKTESFPVLSDKELNQAMAFSFEKELSGGEEGNPIVFGSYLLGPDPDKKDQQLYLLVGAYQDEVNILVQSFVDQGIVPVKVVVKMMALSNLATTLPQGKNAVPVGILNIGSTKSMLAIFQNGRLDFHREIVMGDSDFTKAIIGTIFHEGKAIQFSMEEAEQFKNQFGYPLGFADSMSFKGAPLSELGAMMRPVVERLTGEIQRSIGFYSDKTKGGSLSALYLIGHGAKIKHLDQVLNSRVGVPVGRLPLPKKIVIHGNKKQKGAFRQKFIDHSISFAVASESTLDGNLLPASYKIKAMQKKIHWLGNIAAAFFIFLTCIFSFQIFINNKTIKRKIAVAKKIAIQAETAEMRYARAITQRNALSQEMIELQKRIEQDEDLIQILRLFSNRIPDQLLISSFEYTVEEKNGEKPSDSKRRPGKKTKTEEIPKEDEKKDTVRRLKFEGGSSAPKADVKIAVADFLMFLQESGYFSSMDVVDEMLQESSEENEADESIYWFMAEGVLTD